MKYASFLAAGLLSIAVAGPAAAQPSNGQLAAPQAGRDVVSNPRGLITEFNDQSVGSILGELGAIWQAGVVGDQRIIQANVGGEMIFYLSPTACKGANQTQCIGLAMTALFEGRANPQTVMAFNDRFVFSSSGMNQQGSAYLSRYEIADFGIARGNLATSILVFVAQAKQFQQELKSARQTVALEGYAEDLAAGALNRSGVTALTGHASAGESAVDRHQIGIDNAAQQIRQLIDNDRLPRNKIDNVK